MARAFTSCLIWSLVDMYRVTCNACVKMGATLVLENSFMYPQRIVQLNVQTEEVSTEDDPYAAYQIPDDLMW